MSLITPVKDSNGKTIDAFHAQNIYSGKESCLKHFKKLMGSPVVTVETASDYKRELINSEVETAFGIAVELPELYKYIYEMFPKLYNAAGGSYGRITAVASFCLSFASYCNRFVCQIKNRPPTVSAYRGVF